MTERFDKDELIERLRSEDPAKEDHELPEERSRVRARIDQLAATEPSPPHRPVPRRLLLAAAAVLVAVAVGVSLVIGGSTSGPENALAIDKGPKWVTLTINDPNASDAEMNSELAAAGIDRVRVRSVPGPQKGVGTWAGYAEFGPVCEGGVRKFGFGVDIPATTPFTPANRHSAESMIDLTVPHPDSGALHGEVLGSPYSGATLRIDAETIDNPSYSAKVLVPIRPKRPQDEQQHENRIGPNELIALGGVFAQYGEAYRDGNTSCSDLGLKPIKAATFPPSGPDWVALHISDTPAGVRQMTDRIRAAGIDGEVQMLPAQPPEVGQYMGFAKVPPLPEHSRATGNKLDVVLHKAGGASGDAPTDLALRRSAFMAFSDSRWIFYIGRKPHGAEPAQIVTPAGPQDAAQALRSGCESTGSTLVPTHGPRMCTSVTPLQVPTPQGSHP